MTLDVIVFAVSAVIAVFGAVMMIAQRNTVASVLYLILSLGAQAVLYVQLGALFLGAILIIVYAGAILVLFLFVIMLLNLRGGLDLGGRPPFVSRSVKYLVSFILLLELVYIIRQGFRETVPTGVINLSPEGFGSVSSVATRLFREYVYPFELTGVLLLVAVVGAVVISKRESSREEAAGSDAAGAVLARDPSDEVEN